MVEYKPRSAGGHLSQKRNETAKNKGINGRARTRDGDSQLSDNIVLAPGSIFPLLVNQPSGSFVVGS